MTEIQKRVQKGDMIYYMDDILVGILERILEVL